MGIRIINRIPVVAAVEHSLAGDAQEGALALPGHDGIAAGAHAQVDGILQELGIAKELHAGQSILIHAQHADVGGLDVAGVAIVAHLVPVVAVDLGGDGQQLHHGAGVHLAVDGGLSVVLMAEVDLVRRDHAGGGDGHLAVALVGQHGRGSLAADDGDEVGLDIAHLIVVAHAVPGLGGDGIRHGQDLKLLAGVELHDHVCIGAVLVGFTAEVHLRGVHLAVHAGDLGAKAGIGRRVGARVQQLDQVAVDIAVLTVVGHAVPTVSVALQGHAGDLHLGALGDLAVDGAGLGGGIGTEIGRHRHHALAAHDFPAGVLGMVAALQRVIHGGQHAGAAFILFFIRAGDLLAVQVGLDFRRGHLADAVLADPADISAAVGHGMLRVDLVPEHAADGLLVDDRGHMARVHPEPEVLVGAGLLTDGHLFIGHDAVAHRYFLRHHARRHDQRKAHHDRQQLLPHTLHPGHLIIFAQRRTSCWVSKFASSQKGGVHPNTFYYKIITVSRWTDRIQPEFPFVTFVNSVF